MSDADGRTCANCRFWAAGVCEVERSEDDAATTVDEIAETAPDLGLCRRCPQFVTRVASCRCGERQPQGQVGQTFD